MGKGKMKYLSQLRDKYSILPPLRGFCSTDAVRSCENPSEGAVGGIGAIGEGLGCLLVALWTESD